MKQPAAQQLEWMILGAAIANRNVLRHVGPEQFGVPRSSSLISALKSGGSTDLESKDFIEQFDAEMLDNEQVLAAIVRVWDRLCSERSRDDAIEKIERSLHDMKLARAILTNDQLKSEMLKLADQIKSTCKEN